MKPKDYYNRGGIECWDVIEAWDLDYNLGCVLKYIARAGYKGAMIPDLEKAVTYLQREIEVMRRLERKGAGIQQTTSLGAGSEEAPKPAQPIDSIKEQGKAYDAGYKFGDADAEKHYLKLFEGCSPHGASTFDPDEVGAISFDDEGDAICHNVLNKYSQAIRAKEDDR